MLLRHIGRLVIVAVAAMGVAYPDAIVPGGLAGVEGNSNNNFPFNPGFTMRYQQVYNASEFGAGGTITQILFRPDGPFGSAFSGTVSNIRIDLSTSSAGADGLSTTFANNVGSDNSVVFQGALTLSSAFAGPSNGPRDFDIVINLTNPFIYTPGLGNLLLDVRQFNIDGVGMTFDSEDTTGDSTSRMYDISVSSTTGFLSTSGLVTKFTFGSAVTPVPEPSTLIPLTLAGLLLGRKRIAHGLRKTSQPDR